MAIVPKTKYPSQTLVTDAAYPHGKARNVVTPGDGTGTPWEADLVNDIFGFQQALLAAAAITPSNLPDKVGTSQYVDAIKALIDRVVTRENTWTKKQTFALDVVLTPAASLTLKGNSALGITPATDGGSDYPIHKVQLPLNPTQAPGWTFGTGANPAWAAGSGGPPFVVMVGRDALPTGAIIRAVRACVYTQIQVTLEVAQVYFDTTTTNAGARQTVYSDSFSPSGLQAHVLSPVIPDFTLNHNNELYQLMITVDPIAGNGCVLRWIEIEYYDTLLCNF